MKNKYSVPALEKGLGIIEMLAESDCPLGITDIYEKNKLPKSSIFMILNTLEQLQYVQKTSDGKYKLTLKVYNVGMIALSKLEIRDVARPYMEDLAQQLHFTVHLAAYENGKAVYIEKVNGPGFVQFSTKIGQSQFLHNSAVGKALAAYLSEQELMEAIRTYGLPSTTENAISTPEQFLAFLSSVREMGFAIEDEEGEVGIRCVAAPIYDNTSKAVASIGITALRNELPGIKFMEIGGLIKERAFQISRDLGYLKAQSNGFVTGT